jgi:hypothetical protein
LHGCSLFDSIAAEAGEREDVYMAYHISQIINSLSKSVAVVNQASSPDGRDSRIWSSDSNNGINNAILIQKLELAGTIPYDSASSQRILNVYTTKDNWFLWDNGKNALIGVGENTPNQNDSFYKGEGTNLILTIDKTGQISFAKDPN